MLTENEITSKIIGAAIEVHKSLGPGLLESAYKKCLAYKLSQSGLYIECEKEMPLTFEAVKMDVGYRMDILVENQIVVQLKSVETINDVHLAQIMTYLKLGNYKLGLLINFNVFMLKDGVRRVANKL